MASPGTELPERAVALRNCHPPFCAQVRLVRYPSLDVGSGAGGRPEWSFWTRLPAGRAWGDRDHLPCGLRRDRSVRWWSARATAVTQHPSAARLRLCAAAAGEIWAGGSGWLSRYWCGARRAADQSVLAAEECDVREGDVAKHRIVRRICGSPQPDVQRPAASPRPCRIINGQRAAEDITRISRQIRPGHHEIACWVAHSEQAKIDHSAELMVLDQQVGRMKIAVAPTTLASWALSRQARLPSRDLPPLLALTGP